MNDPQPKVILHRDGDRAPIIVTDEKCLIRTRIDNKRVDCCAIYFGPCGTALRSYTDHVLVNGEPASVRVLNVGDEIQLPCQTKIQVQEVAEIRPIRSSRERNPADIDEQLSALCGEQPNEELSAMPTSPMNENFDNTSKNAAEETFHSPFSADLEKIVSEVNEQSAAVPPATGATGGNPVAPRSTEEILAELGVTQSVNQNNSQGEAGNPAQTPAAMPQPVQPVGGVEDIGRHLESLISDLARNEGVAPQPVQPEPVQQQTVQPQAVPPQIVPQQAQAVPQQAVPQQVVPAQPVQPQSVQQQMTQRQPVQPQPAQQQPVQPQPAPQQPVQQQPQQFVQQTAPPQPAQQPAPSQPVYQQPAVQPQLLPPQPVPTQAPPVAPTQQAIPARPEPAPVQAAPVAPMPVAPAPVTPVPSPQQPPQAAMPAVQTPGNDSLSDLPDDLQAQLNDLVASLQEETVQDSQQPVPHQTQQLPVQEVAPQAPVVQPTPTADLGAPVAPMTPTPAAPEPPAAPAPAAPAPTPGTRSVADILGAMGMEVPGAEEMQGMAATPGPQPTPTPAAQQPPMFQTPQAELPPQAAPAPEAPQQPIEQAAAGPSEADASAEEDIQAYMNRLLNRSPEIAATAAAVAQAAEEAQLPPEPVKVLSAEEFVPQHKATRPANYDSLREIANSSVRSAIEQSTRKEKFSHLKTRLGVFVLSLIGAGVAIYFEQNLAALAAMFVGGLSLALCLVPNKKDKKKDELANSIQQPMGNQQQQYPG